MIAPLIYLWYSLKHEKGGGVLLPLVSCSFSVRPGASYGPLAFMLPVGFGLSYVSVGRAETASFAFLCFENYLDEITI